MTYQTNSPGPSGVIPCGSIPALMVIPGAGSPNPKPARKDHGGNPGREFPTRIQLSRKKGFNLQRASMELNGLPCVVVSRPSKWGNPFHALDGDNATAVEWFANVASRRAEIEPSWIAPLRGKNLACWCKIGEPCHADVLLRVANA